MSEGVVSPRSPSTIVTAPRKVTVVTDTLGRLFPQLVLASTHPLVARETYAAGHAAGRMEAETELAASITSLASRYADLDASWRAFTHATRDERIAREIASGAEWAARQNWITWKGQYPGGPVEWETGHLVQARLGVAA